MDFTWSLEIHQHSGERTFTAICCCHRATKVGGTVNSSKVPNMVSPPTKLNPDRWIQRTLLIDKRSVYQHANRLDAKTSLRPFAPAATKHELLLRWPHKRFPWYSGELFCYMGLNLVPLLMRFGLAKNFQGIPLQVFQQMFDVLSKLDITCQPPAWNRSTVCKAAADVPNQWFQCMTNLGVFSYCYSLRQLASNVLLHAAFIFWTNHYILGVLENYEMAISVPFKPCIFV